MGKKKSRSDIVQERDANASPDAYREPHEGAQEPGVWFRKKAYRQELARLQVDMFKLQQWVTGEGQRLVVILEGLGPAGKKGTARRIEEGLDRRVCQIVSLDAPGKRARGQWYFQRYVEHFPRSGRISIFDGSWYHGPLIERALGLYTEHDFGDFLRSCVEFEQTLTMSGITLVKYWFAAGDEQQQRRFQSHIPDIVKRWKLNPPESVLELRSADFQAAQNAVFAATDLPQIPWYRVRADDKRRARLNCMRHLLSLVPEEGKAVQVAGALPASSDGSEPAETFNQKIVPEVY